MKTYKVTLVGLGGRGKVHLKAFLENSDRFELVAICDMNEERLNEAKETFGIQKAYTDAETMLASERPDVFCFATLPNVRLALVELAAKYKVKALAFEKPMATSLQEAAQIYSICQKNGIKAIISHQQKYISSLQKLKSIVEAGEIGETTKIVATTQAWLSQLGTHFMDYMIWINGGAKAKWAVGHVHGKGKLTDRHPSPDYMMGKVLFENGVFGYIECGYLSPSHMDQEKFWVDNRLTVHGTHGYAWADTDGRWGAFTPFTNGEMLGGEGLPWKIQEHQIQVPYIKELADWLDHDQTIHPCHIEISYHGYQALEAICLSALDHKMIHLPLDLTHHEDVIERMKKELP